MSRKHQGKIKGNPVTYQIPSPAGGVQMETFVPWTLVKRGFKKQVITPRDMPQEFLEEARREQEARELAQDTPLIRALGLAHHWQRLLDEGRYRTMTEIAEAEEIDLGQASRIARLTQLAPYIVEACMAGEGNGLALEHLIRRVIPVGWEEQRQKFQRGFKIEV
ncbi:hypothetical protein [Ferrovum sp.]|uniref:hypothetical protein n=1 Tax=Ferrovum sp. TaxID=2609467 RepID=UPI00262DF2DD|nr:hypothetical protein [Ferrovum sp.]